MSELTPEAMRCDALLALPETVAVGAFDNASTSLSLDEVRVYIEDIDFSDARGKMMSDEGGGWSNGQVERAERLYRNWLFLRAKHRDELMPPTAEIDEFWHRHILDSNAYFRDCQQIFGGYFHHFPYFGTRGPEDEKLLQEAFQNTLRRYEEEFGESLPASEATPRL